MNAPQARNVLGGPLETCGTDPVTGWFRDGCCNTDPGDVGSHTICASVSKEFLDHQAAIGNNLGTPAPQYGFPGLKPGDRWCVTAANWLRAHMDGVAAPVVLASTHELATEIVPLEILKQYAVDVPSDLTDLGSLEHTGDPDGDEADPADAKGGDGDAEGGESSAAGAGEGGAGGSGVGDEPVDDSGSDEP